MKTPNWQHNSGKDKKVEGLAKVVYDLEKNLTSDS